jgi:subtilisin
VKQLKRLKGTLTHLAGVQELKIIHAISCNLRSAAELLAFPFISSIEEDGKMSVHAIIARKQRVNRIKRLPDTFYIPWGVSQIKAPLTWNKADGQMVKIGVIDTGIDYSHPDLRHCIGHGINLIHTSMPPLDDNGHGTHIAGTIAAAGTPQGIVGVAPKATIHAVKAFDRNGSAYVSDIIAGIDWCVQNDLDIINMSFGMKTYNKSLELAVKNAYRSGIIIVASCGNDGRKAFIDYPARFPHVISVGATTRNNKVAPFSNRGRKIDVYAPGEKIYSAWLHGKYHELSGTSMATSHVSGVIALMLSAKPNLKPVQIKQILKKSSIALGKNKKAGWSAGRINARRAINALIRKT